MLENKFLGFFMYCTAKKWSLFVLCVQIILLASSCSKDTHDHPDLSTGEQLFNYHCSSCHNKTGMGSFLKGIPSNITTKKNQTEIISHIKKGNQNLKDQMPVYSDMPDKEAKKIAFHLLTLKHQYFNNPENKNKLLLQQKK